MIKVAQALATFTNNANNDMHKALEDFEEKVIEAFKYTSVCYIGGFPFGKKRRRRREADVGLEDEEEMEDEDDKDNEEDEIVNASVGEEDDHSVAVSPNNFDSDAETRSLVYQNKPPTMKPIMRLEKRLEIAGKAEDSEKFKSVKYS